MCGPCSKFGDEKSKSYSALEGIAGVESLYWAFKEEKWREHFKFEKPLHQTFLFLPSEETL